MERRNNPRVEIDLKLGIFRDKNFERSVVKDSVITNISKKGLDFISHTKFKAGEQVYMKYGLVGGLIVKMKGRIIWVRWENMFYSHGVDVVSMDWLSRRNLEQGFLSQFYTIKKSKTQVIIEFVLLGLAVVLLSRFLNQLPLAYTLGMFVGFLGTFYIFMLIRNA